MKTSEKIDALAAALAKAQSEIEPPTKDKTVEMELKSGRKVKYSYADLSTVLAAVRGPLTKNGLTLSHATESENGTFKLSARLMHSSGQWIEATYPLPSGASPQDMGSAITYARRYTACALIGIATEDDEDGEAATVAHKAPQKPEKRLTRVPVPPPPPAPAKSTPSEPLVVPDDAPSDPTDDRQWEVATILKVAEKVGKKTNGQPWTRYGVLLSLQDGQEQWVNTFDTDFGATASSLQGGNLARVALKPGKPWNGKETFDLVGIEPMGEEEGNG